MGADIENEYGTISIPDYENVIRSVIDASLDFLKCPYECEINVLLTDNERIRSINRSERNMDASTDVLSFPMLEYDVPGVFDDDLYDEAGIFNPDTGELILGDIVISVDKVYEQAKAYNHSATRELAFLVAHSMLHLSGYDHVNEDERLVMEELQENILKMKGYTRDYEEKQII